MRLLVICLTIVVLALLKFSSDYRATLRIHKLTLYCLDTESAMSTLLHIFKNEVKHIPVVDEKLKARGIQWLRLESGVEIHLVPPNVRRHIELFRSIVDFENEHPIEECPLKDNHVGIMVRNLSGHVRRARDSGVRHSLYRREDGMYQFYVHIPGCINYMELSSRRYDDNANVTVHKFT